MNRDELLYEAGKAMHRAGLRFDIVLAIANALGIKFAAVAPVDRGQQLLAGMARLAAKRCRQRAGRWTVEIALRAAMVVEAATGAKVVNRRRRQPGGGAAW